MRPICESVLLYADCRVVTRYNNHPKLVFALYFSFLFNTSWLNSKLVSVAVTLTLNEHYHINTEI